MTGGARREQLSALILAGGRATRIGGIDKRLIEIDGSSIFDRQCAVLAPRVSEIIVSTTASVAGYRTVADAVPGIGPLAGIAAGLAAARTPRLFVLAGDMPYVHGELIDRMTAHSQRPGADGVGLRVNDLPEQLVSLLRETSCAAEEERLISAGRYKASELLTDAGLEVVWIDEAELRAIDPELRMLANINEPSDLT